MINDYFENKLLCSTGHVLETQKAGIGKGIAVRCTGRFSYRYLRSCGSQLKSLTPAPFLYPELLGRHQRRQLCVVSMYFVSMLLATATALDTYSYSAFDNPNQTLKIIQIHQLLVLNII